MLRERFGVEHSTLQVEHVADATGLQIKTSAGSQS
jgi:hypothetical protein